MWTLYDKLIASVGDAERVACVRQGEGWTAVVTDSGLCGVCATQQGRRGAALDEARFLGMPLREAAAFSKSWELEEASVGVAAINAWHNRAAWLPVRENADAFLRYRSRAEGKRVGVIGRFAYLEKRLEPICDLYVIERRPGAKDYPDAACEYLLPEMDAVFITGSTAANKTLPRLLELSRHAFTAVCGPSTTMAAELFPFGADALCGFCITDADKALHAAKNGTSIFECGEMAVLERKNE